jgi:uncharacterized protein DUF4260
MAFMTAPTVLLRAEGATLLALSVFLYWHLEGSWIAFIALLLAPDIGMIGYLRGPRLGAVTYNLTHVEVLPAALAFAAFTMGYDVLMWPALIWLAHIGMDRLLGYGLKLPTAFQDTHLGRIGRR